VRGGGGLLGPTVGQRLLTHFPHRPVHRRLSTGRSPRGSSSAPRRPSGSPHASEDSTHQRCLCCEGVMRSLLCH
jgi:hypothetical protein